MPPELADPDLLAAWDNHLAARLSDNSRKAYLDDLATFRRWTAARAEPGAAVDGGAVREYLAWLATQGNAGRPYARTSVTRKLAALRSFYAFLCGRGRFDVTPIPSARALKVKAPRPLPRFLGRAEADRLLAAPPEWTPAGRRDRAVMEFAYGAGVRLGELAALDLGDLDRRRLAATVTGKGNRQRRVIYGARCAAALDAYLDYGRPAILAGAGEVGDGAALWLNLDAGRLSVKSIAALVKRHAAAAGLTGAVTVHALRHSFATRLIEGGADLRTVQTLLGHASPAKTQLYTHITQQESRRALLEFHPRANPGRRRPPRGAAQSYSGAGRPERRGSGRLMQPALQRGEQGTARHFHGPWTRFARRGGRDPAPRANGSRGRVQCPTSRRPS